MSDKELAEQLKHSSPQELYVVTWDNQLKLLKCPFRVLVLVNIGILKKGLTVVVNEVKVTAELRTVFIIKNDAYYYYYFDFVL
ncbi:hypothetical protein G4D82_04885 [Flavobacterium sp. CYK-4]|uniref:hypothetical protein n=1 Tax=Flavobacterium lotistagni TaxID=2709660 RepID=UPI00140A561F|nr:hypothetical protein [Flavobacterium lotistagni]NHM06547.1 hypothetical protein [Flavobacterium lotistagni]